MSDNAPNSEEIFTKVALIGSFLLFMCQTITEGDIFPPYMRLPLDTKALAKFSVGYSGLTFGHFDGTMKNSADNGSYQLGLYYYCRRWMWIQMPWFALKYKFELSDAVLELKRRQEARLGFNSSNDGSIGTLRSRKSDHMRGFWNIKRVDPSEQQDMKGRSSHAMRSMTKVSASAEAEEYPIVHFSPEKTFPLKRLKPLHKYRRSLRDTLTLSGTNQFSRPSLRSLHHNTLFPSTARDLLDRHIDLLKVHNNDPFILASAVSRVGDKVIPIDLDLYSEVQNIYTNDTSVYSDVNKEDVTETETIRVTKLRLIADKAQNILEHRRSFLEAMKAEFESRNAQDGNISSSLHSGEDTIKALELKFEEVADAVEEAGRMNTGYQQILQVCDANPSHTKHQIALLEQVLLYIAEPYSSPLQAL